MSNWQNVQLNSDLFSDMQKYLYTKKGLIKTCLHKWYKKAGKKINKGIEKFGLELLFKKEWMRKFCDENIYKNLIQMPNETLILQLVLDWVYGYRGSDPKRNLWLLDDKVWLFYSFLCLEYSGLYYKTFTAVIYRYL